MFSSKGRRAVAPRASNGREAQRRTPWVGGWWEVERREETGKAQAGARGRGRRNPKQGKRCVVVARVFAGLSKGATTRARTTGRRQGFDAELVIAWQLSTC